MSVFSHMGGMRVMWWEKPFLHCTYVGMQVPLSEMSEESAFLTGLQGKRTFQGRVDTCKITIGRSQTATDQRVLDRLSRL